MDDDVLQKPPHNIGAEQSVIGGLLLDNAAYDKIAGVLSAHDFYTRDHRLIYQSITKILDANKPADIVTLAEALDASKQLDDVGGISYIGELVQTTPSSANIERYGEIVRDMSLLRQILTVANEISNKIYNRNDATSRELLDLAQSKFMAIGENFNRAKESMQSISDVMKLVTDLIDEAATNPTQDDVTGLRTGLDDLDKMTTGMQPGDLIIVAGRPSMGKTSFALNIVENACLNQRKNAAFFSLEMTNNQLGIRLLSGASRLPSQRVRVGRLYDHEWSALTMGVSKLNDCGMYLDEESTLSVIDIRARARRLHRQLDGKLDLLVVDYLQLIATQGGDTRANEMADVSRKLKLLAKELQIPIIALSQLNRGLEQRPNKRPVMSDLRDSGGIEQDADAIFFIYRDEVYNPDSSDKGTAEIIIGKQRNGPIGTVRATFINHLTRFENYAYGSESSQHHDN